MTEAFGDFDGGWAGGSILSIPAETHHSCFLPAPMPRAGRSGGGGGGRDW